jgi:hypothetical protein
MSQQPTPAQRTSIADIRRFYLERRATVFNEPSNASSANLRICFGDGDHGYSATQNRIEIYLGDNDLDPGAISHWQTFLLHEMVHEYEHKILKYQSDADGNKLMVSLPVAKRFDSTHKCSFYTAVIRFARLLGEDPLHFYETI